MGGAPEGPGPPAGIRTGLPRRARLRARAAAAAIDVVVVLAVCLFLPQPFPPALPLVLMVVYQALTTWWLRASVGKALLGLRVVRLDGDVTLWWSLLRAGPGQLVLTVLGLGWVMVAIRPDGRPMHDRVLRSDVLVVEPTAVPAHRAAARLAEWARRRQEVAQRKRNRTWAGLAVLWAWLAGLGGAVQRGFEWLHGGGASGQSAAATMSTSVAAAIGGAAAAVVALVLAPFPPLAGAAEWLVSPRYWVGAAPESNGPGTGATARTDAATTDPGDPPLQGRWAMVATSVPDGFPEVVVEFVPVQAAGPPSWDVLLLSGPEACDNHLDQVVARVEHDTQVDGRPVHPDSYLQVVRSVPECSSLRFTQLMYADDGLTPDFALYLDGETLVYRDGFHDSARFERVGLP